MTPSPTVTTKQAEVRLMGGGKFIGDTTYHQNYRNKTESSEPIPKPIKHKK